MESIYLNSIRYQKNWADREISLSAFFCCLIKILNLSVLKISGKIFNIRVTGIKRIGPMGKYPCRLFLSVTQYARTRIIKIIFYQYLCVKRKWRACKEKVKFIIVSNNYFLKDVKIYSMKMRQKVEKRKWH